MQISFNENIQMAQNNGLRLEGAFNTFFMIIIQKNIDITLDLFIYI